MHNMSYLVYEEKTDKKDIEADIHEIASEEGDGYCSKLTWHNIEPMANYEEAKRQRLV